MALGTDHSQARRRRFASLRPLKLAPPRHPALLRQAEERADAFGTGSPMR